MKELAKSMKRMLCVVCVLASGLGTAAPAQAGRPAKPDSVDVPITGATRVAIINFQQAVAQTNEFQRDLANLRKKYAPREQALEQLNDQIEALKKQVQDEGAALSGARRQADLEEIDDKTTNLQRTAQDLRNDEQSDEQETVQQVAGEVGPVMISYARKQGFGVVLDASGQTSAVLWWTPEADITKAVVDAYNAKSGVPAPTSMPAAPAPNTPGH